MAIHPTSKAVGFLAYILMITAPAGRTEQISSAVISLVSIITFDDPQKPFEIVCCPYNEIDRQYINHFSRIRHTPG